MINSYLYLVLKVFPSRETDLYRGIVQLVERWSPKPNVEGSNPSAPAIFLKIKTIQPFSYGSVAQLVRVPACHAGGRGFEPLLSRFVEV